MSSWTVSQIPNQQGRRALITGANSGIGYHAALELTRRGAHVLLASRDRSRGEAALARLLREVPAAQAEVCVFDLASLDSVRVFAASQVERGLPLDLLINNAGVMAPPKRLETVDGFELQFGTNVLGHFALTALLFPLLGNASRVVTIASIAHKSGAIDFNDLQATRRYGPMKSYQQSKLANLMLALEMDRRLGAAGSSIRSVAAHPGVANTNLFVTGDRSRLELAVRKAFGGVIARLLNTDAEGAIPTLYAAAAPEAEGGGYYGPQGFQEMRGGDVGPAKITARAKDEQAARRLWTVCEELTGVPLLEARAAAAPAVPSPS